MNFDEFRFWGLSKPIFQFFGSGWAFRRLVYPTWGPRQNLLIFGLQAVMHLRLVCFFRALTSLVHTLAGSVAFNRVGL